MEKILPISLKLNFTPNTLGCYWLSTRFLVSLTFRGLCTKISEEKCKVIVVGRTQ